LQPITPTLILSLAGLLFKLAEKAGATLKPAAAIAEFLKNLRLVVIIKGY
jgi:hypothetical protein